MQVCENTICLFKFILHHLVLWNKQAAFSPNRAFFIGWLRALLLLNGQAPEVTDIIKNKEIQPQLFNHIISYLEFSYICSHVCDIHVARSFGIAFLNDVSCDGYTTIRCRRVPCNCDVVTVCLDTTEVARRIGLVWEEETHLA